MGRAASLSSTLVLVAVVGIISPPSLAQTLSCWIDAKSGLPVDTWPHGADPRQISLDPNANQYSNPVSGRNFVRPPGGSWIDSATGQPVDTWPHGADPRQISLDPNANQYSNPVSGRNFVRVPCPPLQSAASSGLYIGGEFVKNWGRVRSTERLAGTDLVTNQFSDSADPVGGGFIIGYTFAPWANSIIVSPFGSFDFLHSPVNHSFAGGSYLGTTASFMGTFGVKVGPQLGPLWFYGIAGVSVLNETLNVNFIPVGSSQSATVAGATVGIGGAFRPSFLQSYGLPLSVFAEYQHTWWQDADFNQPLASPLFNYNFRRDDDVVKLGFVVSLSPPPPPIGGPKYVKALPAK